MVQDEAPSRDRKRQRVEGVQEVIATELPRNLLECPICFYALTIPTFQCNNGHIACSSCCTKLKNICPTCKVPIGKIRNRFAESVLEASIVPCLNAKHGCTLKFPYGKELAHEEICAFALCYCPAPNCNCTGIYKDLYKHYYANHWNVLGSFRCGIPHKTLLYNDMENKVIQESPAGLLVVVQYLKVEQGIHVTVNCIAPCALEAGKFSYQISYKRGHHSNVFGPVKMNRIQKVSLQNPKKGSCLFVPDYFVKEEYLLLRMDICIRRLGEDEQVPEEEDSEEGAKKGVEGTEEGEDSDSEEEDSDSEEEDSESEEEGDD